ncbi:MAG: hypothetical protein ABI335_05640 [Polyangiaceae bacterium]
MRDGLKAAVTTRPGMPAVVGGVWFVLTFGLVMWMWGLNPLVFPSPDEAVVRYSAQLIGEHGSPILPLHFDDPEDLAHPRSWVTLGSSAVPTYAPASLYAFGYLMRLGQFGLFLIMVLPATAVGAFAAGTAHLLPPGRRWLAFFAPLLAFPAFYWLVRPWANHSPMLAGVTWSFFFWARWRRFDGLRDLSLSALCIGVAAAVRPDYAGFLLLAALLASLAASPPQWKRTFILFSVAGVLALGSNLFLNKLLTGHPLQAAYQVALERQWGPQDAGATKIPGLGILKMLLVPMGWPVPHVAVKAFLKYWVRMGPIAMVLVGQLTIIPLLRNKSWLARTLYGALFFWCAFFIFTRLHDDVFGGNVRFGWAEHSVPRYLTPAYLIAAVPPILFLGRCRRALFFPGLVVTLAVASAALYEIGVRQPSSFQYLHDYVPQKQTLLDELRAEIPEHSMVYTVTSDKIIWSAWPLGTIDDLRLSASSMARAFDAGFNVFMLDPKFQSPSHHRLSAMLGKNQFVLVPVNVPHGVYRMQRGVTLWPEGARD